MATHGNTRKYFFYEQHAENSQLAGPWEVLLFSAMITIEDASWLTIALSSCAGSLHIQCAWPSSKDCEEYEVLGCAQASSDGIMLVNWCHWNRDDCT